MFTGIIEEIGTVQAVKRGARSAQITVKASRVLEDIHEGDSISINGVCLTVTTYDRTSFTLDVMPETLNRSNLGTLTHGSRINLERAVQMGGRLGGHLVSGHVDGTGRILSRRTDENAEWFTISADKEVLRYIAVKGSVAIDGISLTVAGADDRSFSVSIIPHTQQETTLTGKKTGDTVNIECDMIAKYIEKLISKEGIEGGITLDFLTDKGFTD